MSSRGEVNGWGCDTCGEVTYVVHVDDGVTPMFLACRADAIVDERYGTVTFACDGQGTSLMYPGGPLPAHVVAAVRWEWFRPSARRVRRMEPAMRQHIENGGLELRPITAAGRRALEEAA